MNSAFSSGSSFFTPQQGSLPTVAIQRASQKRISWLCSGSVSGKPSYGLWLELFTQAIVHKERNHPL
jgi:hypothetical protein